MQGSEAQLELYCPRFAEACAQFGKNLSSAVARKTDASSNPSLATSRDTLLVPRFFIPEPGAPSTVLTELRSFETRQEELDMLRERIGQDASLVGLYNQKLAEVQANPLSERARDYRESVQRHTADQEKMGQARMLLGFLAGMAPKPNVRCDAASLRAGLGPDSRGRTPPPVNEVLLESLLHPAALLRDKPAEGETARSSGPARAYFKAQREKLQGIGPRGPRGPAFARPQTAPFFGFAPRPPDPRTELNDSPSWAINPDVSENLQASAVDG